MPARRPIPLNAEGLRICETEEDFAQALHDAYEATAAAKAYASGGMMMGKREVHEMLCAPKGVLLQLRDHFAPR